jgi:hypothetical protein
MGRLRTAPPVSLKEAARLYRTAQKRVAALRARAQKLERKLSDVRAELALLEGGRREPRRPARTARPAEPAARRAAPRRKRTGPSIRLRAVELLKSRGPLPAKDIARAILQGGYKTRSKQFLITVYGILHRSKEFKKQADGRFALAS